MKKSKAKPRPNFPNTRKAIRKQKRQEKKVHRKEHYTHKKIATEQAGFTAGRFVKRPADISEHKHEVKKKKPNVQPALHDILNRERRKDQKEEKQLKSQMEEQRRKIMLQANEEEEKVIKKLEKQLGLKKSKNKNNFFADDGLDYLLEICDRTTTEQIVAAEKHLANVEDESDFEDDLATITGKDVDSKKDKQKKKSKPQKEKDHDEKLDHEDDGESEIDDMSDDEELSGVDEGESEDDLEESGEEEEISDEEGSDGFGDIESENEEPQNKSPKKPVSKTKINNKSKKTKLENGTSKSEKKSTENIDDDDEDIENPFSDDEVSHLSDDDKNMSGDDDNDDDTQTTDKSDAKPKENPDEWEDIYGRKRDNQGNVIKEEKGVYIPPHLRNKDSTSDKDMELIERQIKSILNKLSGSNLHWAGGSLEAVYAAHSRASVNSALSRCWLKAAVSDAVASERMQSELAALLAAASANVASDIGAHFLLVLAKTFDEMMTSPPEPIADKKLVNLVACFAHLYNFKMYHSSLLYDVLTRLLEDLTEKNIECILAVLRIVGGVLRKDNPIALKNYIQSAQTKVSGLNESAAIGSRIKFLLEVLLAVKNNNLTKIPSYDPSYGEQLKKSLKTVVRPGNYVTALNIRMEDLLKADERGKWWIVGSAWEGQRVRPEVQKAGPLPGADQKLLELARAQRMNTDVRRSVFCIVMSAEDYMDAFEKLQRLGLKGQQDREIVHVLLACCLQEKTFNRYYALLAQKLIESDRKFLLSIQCSVWDKIKELDTLSKQTLANLAQLLIHLITEKGLALSVLKVIQFSDLNKSSVKFMRQILLSIIMNEDLQASLEVFLRIAKAPKLHMFRESLRLFIQHFLIRNAGKKASVLSDAELKTLKERSLAVEKILSMHESKLRF